jgi:hypothetical protein
MNNELQILKTDISEIYTDNLKSLSVFKPEDKNFLIEKREHLTKVCEKTFMWRTNLQKKSIISDFYFPTVHGKFHQAILEQKVQFEQALGLAKDFEETKLKIETKEIELEELEEKLHSSTDEREIKKAQIEIKQKKLDIGYLIYGLKNQQTAMNYRMAEVRGWQELEERLLLQMREQGYTEDEIWNKEYGELTNQFFTFLNNYIGIDNSTDAGEVQNLTALARHAVSEALKEGIFESLVKKCNPIQLESLRKLGYIRRVEQGETTPVNAFQPQP